MQLLAITIYAWSRIFFHILVATKFKCAVGADVDVHELCMDSKQLEVGKEKMRGSFCRQIALFYLSHSLIQPKSPVTS